MNYLIDTNIISELVRPRPNVHVIRWADTVIHCAMSVISLEELEFGLAWKPRTTLKQWLDDFLVEHIELLPITPVIARQAGKLRGLLQATGRTCQQADMLIAATASTHGLTLVTRNVKNFRGTGVAILNPFAGLI